MRITSLLKLLVIFFTIAIVFSTIPSSAEDQADSSTTAQPAQKNPFASSINEAMEYFAPLEGTVISAGNGTIQASLNAKANALKGMRVRVFRKGEPFLHPITKEMIVEGETPVGVAEVTATGAGAVTLALLDGKAASGDTIRISSGQIKALFYQNDRLDWDASEEYYFWLKDQGRFSLVETAPGSASMDDIAGAARKWGAELAIIVNSSGTHANPILKQTLMWASDSKVFSVRETPIKPSDFSAMKAGVEYFIPNRNKPNIQYDLPFTATMIAAGDFNGDGVSELALAARSRIYFLAPDIRLKPAFGKTTEVVLKHQIGQMPVWLETFDLDSDGADELILSVLQDGKAISYIYTYRDGVFKNLWTGNGYIQVIGGTVYTQAADPMGGLRGKPTPLAWAGKLQQTAPELPDGADLYNILLLESQGQHAQYAMFDRLGHLCIIRASGQKIWSSEQSYSPFNRAFPRQTIAEVEDQNEWRINNRIMALNDAIYTLKRFRYKTNIKTNKYGTKKTALMQIHPSQDEANGNAVTNIVADKLRAGSVDFTISNGRLYVLSGSSVLNPSGLFKGRSLFFSKLTVYILPKGVL